jgi:protein TonB
MDDGTHPLPTRARIERLIGAAVAMIAGSGLILWTVVVMNAHDTAREDQEQGGQEIVVDAPRKEPPKRPEKKPPPKRTRTSDTARRAPLPNLSTALSGLAFGLPQLEGIDVGEAARRLLGSQSAGEMVMNANTVDQQPKVLERGRAAYPARARAKNIEGWVKLTFLINERGEIEQLKVLEAEPPGVFEESAIAAVSSTRYAPAVYQSLPVRFRATQRVPFTLE